MEHEPEEPRFALTLALLLTLNSDSEGALALATSILADSALVGQHIEVVVDLFAYAAARGQGAKALRLLGGNPPANRPWSLSSTGCVCSWAKR